MWKTLRDGVEARGVGIGNQGRWDGEERTRVFQGIVENSLGKSSHGNGGQRGAKEFSKRLWKNGGNPVGVFCGYLEADRSGFPPFFHMSVNPVISTRLVVNTGLGIRGQRRANGECSWRRN